MRCPKLLRLAKTFSAFANSAGGTLFFGIDDEHRYIGLEHLNGTRDLVERVAQFYCKPDVQWTSTTWEPMPGIDILVVEIDEAQEKPVYAVNPKDDKDAWPFFRSNRENLPLDKKSLKTMRRVPSLSLNDHFDKLDRTQRHILTHLRGHPRQTLGQLAKTLNISSHRAKKILVRLEQNGWVHSFFNEKRREFSLAAPLDKHR